MGCGLSQAERPINMRVNILDGEILRKQNKLICQKMQKHQIKYQTYISLTKIIIDMQRQYCNVIITKEQMLQKLKEQLLKVNLFPKILVKLSTNKQKKEQQISPFQIIYFSNYDEIISLLTNRTQNKRQLSININNTINDYVMTLKILRQTPVKSNSQIEIIQHTLKSKNISFQIYHTFVSFQKSFKTIKSNFVVCDYLYHRQVLNLISDPFYTRLICMCSFNRKQSYDPRVYFLTDNWIEVINQVQRQQKWSHLNLVKCTKIFLYSKDEKSLAQYAQILEKFGFDVRIYCDLTKIMTQSKHYFALSIITSPQYRQQVELFMENNDYSFKTKLLIIQKGTQNSIISLRKIIKQLKRGYRGKKQVTRSIDIIDKNFNNGKYLTAYQQFSKCNIICHTYRNIDEYIYSHKYLSSYVVVNEQQSELLLRYMREIKSSNKMILLSRRHSLTSQIKYDAGFCFVSDHFGKIVNFVKSHPVYNPIIPVSQQYNESSMINKKESKQEQDFDKIDPTEIQNEQTDLDSLKIRRYTINFKKTVV